jgi:hypothetical protein
MAWQQIDGELVLLNIEGKELLGLNPVGARIWDLIDGTRAVDEIVDVLAGEFEATHDQLARDVDGFLAQLVAAGAVLID